MLRDGRFSGEELPESIQGIIAARLDALPAEEKHLIQDAAVIGKVFWSGALTEMGGVPRQTVEEWLHALERKEFIRRERRSSMAGDVEFAFRHVLVRDVAYSQIPRAGRSRKHRLAAAWLDSLGGDRAEDRSEMVAHHYGSALDFARASGQETSELEVRARLAFRDAGERALALSALPAALRFFTQAVELWPEDDPDWPLLALGAGRADIDVRQRGDQPLVARALELFLANGDVDRAAEAEALLAECDWFAGRSDSTFARLEHARGLVADRPASVGKAKTYAEMSRFLMLANRNQEAIDIGRVGLALARQLDVRELQASTLNNIGTARVTGGDLGGFGDLEEAFAIAEAINSSEALRALGNQASLVGGHGDLRRARELYERVVELAGKLGIEGFVLWCRVELSLLDYHDGHWDVALQGMDAFLAEVSDAHYMEVPARQVTGAIRIGRGDTERGLADSELALTFARNAKDPQALYPTLAWHAQMLAFAGRGVEAGERADELMALVSEREYPANQWASHMVFALDELGRAADAIPTLTRLSTSTRWRDAALVYATGDRLRAADLLASMDDRTDEAFARLRAAEEGAGSDQTSLALAFYHRVAATAFVRRAEALLPASA
jgi:tetratricopeptide (TPR) repeat protein